MRFLRRKKDQAGPADQATAIAEFWAWWTARGAAGTAAALAERDPGRMSDELSERVFAISDELSWELSWGLASEHALIVTANGDPALRPLARRWRMAAPAADPTWEYSDFRLPVPNPAQLAIGLGGHDVDLGSVVVDAKVDGATVHVSLYHPAFAGLPEEERTKVAFLLLDKVLGEAVVEVWIGEIGTAEAAPPDGTPLVDLPDLVGQVVAANTDENGEPRWVMMRGEGPDGPILAVAQVPLRAVTAPHLDTYVAIVIPFVHPTAEGFPGEGSLQPIRDFEDHLRDRLGGSGRIVAHQTRGGTRILHAYVDGTTPAVEQLRAAVGGWDQGTVELHPESDPDWDAVAHLR